MENREASSFKMLKSIDVSAGSILMACGIFLLGAIGEFPKLNITFGYFFAIILILAWLFMIIQFFISLINVNYRNQFSTMPIKYFGAGTWIAGTSVVCILTINKFPQLTNVLQVIVFLNILGWLIYILFGILQFRKLMKERLVKDVHGVILLTTVSTQSIVCLLINFYQLRTALIFILIVIGVSFYVFSISLIIVRFRQKYHNILEWKNTDCIIHGALSITGLAMTQSQLFSFNFLHFYWYVVFSIFLFVELVELVRGIVRIRKFGLRSGIITYDITQWARNFTFGMFYYFTYNLVNHYGDNPSVSLQMGVMQLLSWVVIVLLILEFYLLLQSKFEQVKF